MDAACVGAGMPATRAEVDEHMLTHLPYRNWCPHCIRGRGARSPGPEDVHEIHLDYCFIKMEGGEHSRAVIVAKDRYSKAIMGTVVPTEGGSGHFPARRIRAFVNEL